MFSSHYSPFHQNQVIGLYPALVNCISAGSNSLCSALKEALIEYHQLLAVPRPVVLASPLPEIFLQSVVAASKDAAEEAPTNGVAKIDAGKPEVAKDEAGDDAEPEVEADPVGEVVLDVNVASEELELDDSLC